MSFHGGLIGAPFAAWLYVRKAKLDWWSGVDLFAPVIPLGYTFGRLGNFINGELFGRRRLDESLRQFGDLAVDQVLRNITWDIRRFVGLAEQSDDLTMIGLRVLE